MDLAKNGIIKQSDYINTHNKHLNKFLRREKKLQLEHKNETGEILNNYVKEQLDPKNIMNKNKSQYDLTVLSKDSKFNTNLFKDINKKMYDKHGNKNIKEIIEISYKKPMTKSKSENNINSDKFDMKNFEKEFKNLGNEIYKAEIRNKRSDKVMKKNCKKALKSYDELGKEYNSQSVPNLRINDVIKTMQELDKELLIESLENEVKTDRKLMKESKRDELESVVEKDEELDESIDNND